MVLRLRLTPDGPALLRNYSLSDMPSADHYRVSVKREVKGTASQYLCTQVKEGDVLEVSAPRGSFTLQPGDGPVVLLSAGVGATPVLAMLHALAAGSSTRPLWWLYGARCREDHPFSQESRDLLQRLPNSRSYIRYSKPAPQDRLGTDFDAPGHIDVGALKQLALPRDAHFYLCGPPSFLHDLTAGLEAWGVSPDHVHSEIFGPTEAITPGIAAETHIAAPARRSGRSGAAGFVCPQRNLGPVGPEISKLARAGRSLRCPRTLVVPHRSLPHL